MSYPKKLLRLRPTKGLVADTPTSEVGPEFYTSGQNVVFRQGFATRVAGSRQAYASLTADPVMHIRNVQLGGFNYWVTASDDAIYAVTSAAETNITPAGGLTAITDPYQWSSASLNGIPIFTNGENELLFWDGNTANDFETLTDWPATTSCKSVATFKYHVFALDIDGPGGHFESQVKWSDAAEPGTIPAEWTPSASNEAGDVELSDVPGPVMCAVPLGGSLMIYKRTAIYQCDYVGGNNKFEFRKAPVNIGALTRRSVCDVNGQHLVVTEGDIVLTDGVNIRSIGQDRMKRYLFDSIDQTYFTNLFVIFNRPKNEVWICFPEAGSQFCTQALVYDVAHDAFGIRDLSSVAHAALGLVDDDAPSQVWDDDSGFWNDDNESWNDAGFSAAIDSFVVGFDQELEVHDTDDATATQAVVAKYDMTFEEPERVKFVRRLHIRAPSGFGTLLVRVGSRMTPSDSITWSSEVSLSAPDQIVNVFAQGRYISVEARSTGTEVWTISGIDLEAELRGYF